MASRNDQHNATGLTRRNLLQLAVAAGLGGLGVAKSAEEPAQSAVASAGAKRRYDLSTLKWQLSGYMPYFERLSSPITIADIHQTTGQKVGPIPASVPGSVQLALLEAGLIKDWNVGLHARDCQWVENLDWVYQTVIPDDWVKNGKQFRLHCEGLDYRGAIFLNGQRLAGFEGSFHPYDVALGPHLKANGNLPQIVFPRDDFPRVADLWSGWDTMRFPVPPIPP